MLYNKQNILKVLIIWIEIISWSSKRSVRCDDYTNQNDSFYYNNKIEALGFIHTTMPMRIYECLYNNLPVLRCAKLLLLSKLNENQQSIKSGRLTSDVLQQFFNITKPMDSLINGNYKAMSDKEIDKCLKERLRLYFENRNIQLQLLPNLMISIKSDPEDKLRVSLKQKSLYYYERDTHGRADNLLDYLNEATSSLFESDDDVDGTHRNRNKDKDEKIEPVTLMKSKTKIPKNKHGKGKMSILQMAVPVMLMPAILMGTFLPFWLPVLKMATLTTLLMNNAAFISALIYAARTHMNINNQEQQHVNYNYDHSAYH